MVNKKLFWVFEARLPLTLNIIKKCSCIKSTFSYHQLTRANFLKRITVSSKKFGRQHLLEMLTSPQCISLQRNNLHILNLKVDKFYEAPISSENSNDKLLNVEFKRSGTG